MNVRRLPDKYFICALFLLGVIFLFVNNLQAYNVQLERDGSRTVFIFNSSRQFSAKLINQSPSSRIMIKLEDSYLLNQHHYPDTLKFHSPSPVLSAHFMKIDNTHLLIIIDLLTETDFELTATKLEVRINIEDNYFRNTNSHFYYEGLYYHRLGDLRKALSFYKEAIDRDESRVEAYFAAGKIYYQWQQNHTAENYFKSALQNGYQNAEIYQYMGNLYRRLNQVESAKSFDAIYQRLKNKEEINREGALKENRQKNIIRIKLV